MRNHRTNHPPSQIRQPIRATGVELGAHSIGVKTIAQDLGVTPHALRRWMRRHGKRGAGLGYMSLFTEDEAQRIIAEYRNGGRR
jgi:transposase-like protein